MDPAAAFAERIADRGADCLWHIRDVNQAYQLGANSFMVKPMEFENYIELSKSIHDYWLLKRKRPKPRGLGEYSRAKHNTSCPRPLDRTIKGVSLCPARPFLRLRPI